MKSVHSTIIISTFAIIIYNKNTFKSYNVLQFMRNFKFSFSSEIVANIYWTHSCLSPKCVKQMILPNPQTTMSFSYHPHLVNQETETHRITGRILGILIVQQKYLGPGGSDSKASACNAGALGWEDPLEKEIAPHSSTLAWKIPWMEELVAYSPWDREESDTTERLHFLFWSIISYSKSLSTVTCDSKSYVIINEMNIP